jgi:hypothetical protein
VALIETALACLGYPIGDGDIQRKLDEAILCGAVCQEWGEVGANPINVMPGEGIVGGKTCRRVLHIFAQN